MKRIISFILIFALFLSTTVPAKAVVVMSTRIELCGINDDDGADRTGWQTVAATHLANIPNSVIYRRTAFNSVQLLNYLSNSNIFVVHTHGNYNVLQATDSNGKETYLFRSAIDALDNDALSQLDVAFLGACMSGATVSTTNMVDAVYSKGASCVIGYKESVVTNRNYTMIESFCTALGGGYSIAQSLAYADANVLATHGDSGLTSNRYVKGDTSTVFNPNMMMSTSLEDDMVQAADPPNGICYFSNEQGIYGFFDFGKLTNNSSSATVYSTESISQNTATVYLESLCQDSSRYSLQDFYYTPDTGAYVFIYNATLCDIKTDDYVTIMLNTNGALISYSKPCEGAFDSVSIESTSICAAEESVNNVFQTSGVVDYNVVDKRIVWDNEVLSLCFIIEVFTTENGESYPSVDEYIIPLQVN